MDCLPEAKQDVSLRLGRTITFEPNTRPDRLFDAVDGDDGDRIAEVIGDRFLQLLDVFVANRRRPGQHDDDRILFGDQGFNGFQVEILYTTACGIYTIAYTMKTFR